jgi:hypothetical protein
VFRTLEERQQFQLIGLLIEREFETADVAAIHDVRARQVFGAAMGDRRPARGTMPWHREEELIAEVNRRCQEPDRADRLLGGRLQELVERALWNIGSGLL